MTSTKLAIKPTRQPPIAHSSCSKGVLITTVIISALFKPAIPASKLFGAASYRGDNRPHRDRRRKATGRRNLGFGRHLDRQDQVARTTHLICASKPRGAEARLPRQVRSAALDRHGGTVCLAAGCGLDFHAGKNRPRPVRPAIDRGSQSEPRSIAHFSSWPQRRPSTTSFSTRGVDASTRAAAFPALLIAERRAQRGYGNAGQERQSHCGERRQYALARARKSSSPCCRLSERAALSAGDPICRDVRLTAA